MLDRPFDRCEEALRRLLDQKVVLRVRRKESMMPVSSSVPGFGWISGDAFAEQAGKSGIAGLPAKIINVDNDAQPSVSQQKCGQLYGDTLSDAVGLEPVLRCPNCGEVAKGLVNGQPIYTRDIAETGGKTHKGALPKCPVPGLEIPQMLFTVEPCGCKVSQEWAGSFSGEMQSRLQGNAPKRIQPMSEAMRAAKLAGLEQKLTKLYSAQALAGDTETKKDADYWIVVVIDQIQRLCPGAHNKAAPRPLDGEVKNWASKNGLPTPDQPVEVKGVDPVLVQGGLKPGQSVYMQKDGTYTTGPSTPGAPSAILLTGPDATGGCAGFATEKGYEGNSGYGANYKPPPGFKGGAAPKKIEYDSLVCAFTLLPNYPGFTVNWSDGLRIDYIGMSEAKVHEHALSNSASAVERARGKALLREMPKIEQALQKVALTAQNKGAAAAQELLKNAEANLLASLLAGTGVPSEIYKGASPDTSSSANVAKQMMEKIWKQNFADLAKPKVNYEEFKNELLGQFADPPNAMFKKADIEKATQPKPYIAPPKLQTLPKSQLDSQINFFGALPEEKEVYIQRLKKIVQGTIKQDEYPKNLLNAIVDYFDTQKGFMTSLVRQEVYQGNCDTALLVATCAAIKKDLQKYILGDTQDLIHASKMLVFAFANHVQVDYDALAKKPASPVPAPEEPAPPSERHVKKKRSIRLLGDDWS